MRVVLKEAKILLWFKCSYSFSVLPVNILDISCYREELKILDSKKKQKTGELMTTQGEYVKLYDL